jgi:hypothetical protein
MDSAFFATLLRDAANLLRPIRVSEVPSPPSKGNDQPSNLSASYIHSHPLRNALLVLSDLYQIFGLSVRTNSDGPRQLNHVAQKLIFYAAHIVSTPPTALTALSQEVLIQSKVFEAEAQQGHLSQTSLRG